MNRKAAERVLKKVMDQIKIINEIEPISQIFVFGSFARGAKEPNDVDIVIVFKTEDRSKIKSNKIYEVYSKVRKADVLFFGSRDFIHDFPATLAEDVFLCIWTEDDKDWKGKIKNIQVLDNVQSLNRPFYFKDFLVDNMDVWAYQMAIYLEFFKCKHIPAQPFYLDKGPWDIKVSTDPDDGPVETMVINEYELLMDKIANYKNNGANSYYCDCYKIMHSLGRKINSHFDINKQSYWKGRYIRLFFPGSHNILECRRYFFLELIHLDKAFRFLMNRPVLEEVYLIPKYKKQRSFNFIYKLTRGPQWKENCMKYLYKLYYEDQRFELLNDARNKFLLKFSNNPFSITNVDLCSTFVEPQL